MRIIFFTDTRDFGSYTAVKGIKKLMAGDARFIAGTFDCLDFKKIAVRAEDLILVGGCSLLSDRLEPFWRWLADLRMIPVVLWGLGVSIPASRTTGVDPEIIKKLRPRILAANVHDELTDRIYGLAGHVSFCPSAAWLSGLGRKTCSGQKRILFVDDPGLLSRKDANLIARACDAVTDNTSVFGRFGYPGIVSRYRRSDVVVTARLEGAITAAGLAVPYIACLPDRTTIEFHRMYKGGILAESSEKTMSMIEEIRGDGQTLKSLEPALVNLDKIAEFAEKFKKILYESLTPVSLGP